MTLLGSPRHEFVPYCPLQPSLLQSIAKTKDSFIEGARLSPRSPAHALSELQLESFPRSRGSQEKKQLRDKESVTSKKGSIQKLYMLRILCSQRSDFLQGGANRWLI